MPTPSTANPLIGTIEDFTPAERLDLYYIEVRISGPDRCNCPVCRPDLHKPHSPHENYRYA